MYDKCSKYVIYTIIDLSQYSGLQNGVGIGFGNGIGVADANADAKEQIFSMLNAVHGDMYDKFSKYIIYTIIHLLQYSGLQNGVSIWFGNAIGVADADADADAKEQIFLTLNAVQ